jgi:hypothetical protein
MLTRKLLLLAIVGAAACAGVRSSAAHCDLAYSSGPAIAYHATSREVVENRTSVIAATKQLTTQIQRKRGASAGPISFDDVTSSEIKAALPGTPKLTTDDPVARQKGLTLWLLYVRKLYEEDQFGTVVSVISDLRTKGLLKDADAQDGYDDGDVRTEAYFSLANLTRILHAYEKPAKLAVLSGTGFSQEYRAAFQATIETQATTFNFERESFDALIDQDKASLRGLGRLQNNFLPVVSQAALGPAATFARAQASEKKWDRITNLANYDEILGVSNDLKNRVDMYVKAGPVMGSLFVNEGTGISTLYAGFNCRNDFETSLRALARTLPQTQKRIALSALVKANDRYVLTVNGYGHIYISEDELNRLMAGESVPGKDSSETDGGFQRVIADLIKTKVSLVLWSHPMMQKKGPAWEATMRFAHALGRAHPDLNIVIDDPNPRVPELAAKIAELSISPQDIYVVIDRQYSVKFQGELADQADDVRKIVGANNVVFFDGKEADLAPSAHERAVIVITGHADSALEAFVDHLAEKGYLKNNLIVLQSCGNALSPRLVSKINNKYGAAGTFHYPEKILETDALTHTKELLKGAAKGSGAFGLIVRDRAAKPSQPWSGSMHGVWTICRRPDEKLPERG